MESINTIYEIIINDPIYFITAIVLGLIVFIGIIKKLLKLFFVVSLIILGYFFYLNYFEKKIPKDLNELSDSIKENVESVGKEAKDLINNENLKEKVKELSNNILENSKDILKKE